MTGYKYNKTTTLIGNSTLLMTGNKYNKSTTITGCIIYSLFLKKTEHQQDKAKPKDLVRGEISYLTMLCIIYNSRMKPTSLNLSLINKR